MSGDAATECAIGIDAGGSGTVVMVGDSAGGLGRHQYPGANAAVDPDVSDRLIAAIRTAAAGRRVVALTAGIAGLSTGGRQEEVTTRLRGVVDNPMIMTDADLGWHAANLSRPASIVLAGTGSIAVTGDNRSVGRAGGAGYLLGDEGSGWWIGREVLRRTVVREGTASDALHQVILRCSGMTAVQLARHLYRDPHRYREVVASLAAALDACDDDEATAILVAAGKHLAELASALPASRPTFYAGGVFRSRRVQAQFVAATGALPAHEEPATAAIRLAWRQRKTAPERC